MKKTFLLALFSTALAPLLTGCIIVGDSDPPPPPPPPPPPGPGYIDATWTLTEGIDAQPITGCSEGITAEIVSVNRATGTQYLDLFNCELNAGVTSALPAGQYDVWVNVYNGSNVAEADLIAQSGYEVVTLQGDDTAVRDFFFPAGGYFSLTWEIDDEYGPNAQCADLNADGVMVQSTLVGPATAVPIQDLFDCDLYEATTPQMLIGEYTIDVHLLNGNESLNLFPVPEAYSLDYGHHVVDLGNFIFYLAE